MVGVVGGLVAAVLWGTSSFVAAFSSRAIGAQSALAWVYVVGLGAALPVALWRGAPAPGETAVAWMAVGAVAAVVGLYLMYAAIARGPVVVVMPLTAAQGGFAALGAVAAGERLAPVAAVALAVTLAGMAVVMVRPRSERAERTRVAPVAIVLAALSAATTGLALFATARAVHGFGTPWVLAILRGAGVVGLTLPLLVFGRLRLPRAATRYVVFSGLADTAAFATYVYAAGRAGTAVPAVISSQYAALTALLGVVALGERATRRHVAGVVAILAGVAVVSAAQS